jgi:hypothetical protein
MQAFTYTPDQIAADQRANLDTVISQLQTALTTAKLAGNPHLANLIREAIAEAMADARLRDDVRRPLPHAKDYCERCDGHHSGIDCPDAAP